MNEILKVIFGDYTFIELFGFIWFLFIGYAIYGLNETSLRDKDGKATPEKWSWKFWYHDNWKRYLATILSTYVLFIFYSQFVGNPLTNFEALMIGLIGDGLGATAKKRIDMTKANREKLMTDINENNKENIG
jgi:hypothetical protein